jgi:hypothetical protein
MSNRLHQKFHRFNHHSVPANEIRDAKYPDKGYDPIASFDSPFTGEFYSQGDLITTQSLTADINGTFGNNVLVGNDLTVAHNLSVTNDVYFGNDVTVERDLRVKGNIQIDGEFSRIETLVYATSAVTITNTGDGPALNVDQTGNNAIANFTDSGNSVFYIEGTQERPGFIGVNTKEPNERFTVFGNISAGGPFEPDDNTEWTSGEIFSTTLKTGSLTAINASIVSLSAYNTRSNILSAGFATTDRLSSHHTTSNILSANKTTVHTLCCEDLAAFGADVLVKGSIWTKKTDFSSSLASTDPSLVVFDTATTLALECTELPRNGNDVELHSDSDVTIERFVNGVKGTLYTLTNKSTSVITITSSDFNFVRNDCTSSQYINLSSNYSCSLRWDYKNKSSIW